MPKTRLERRLIGFRTWPGQYAGLNGIYQDANGELSQGDPVYLHETGASEVHMAFKLLQIAEKGLAPAVKRKDKCTR